MNAKQLIAAVAVFAATGSAFAAEFTDYVNVPSSKTRAEVVAEMTQSRAAGSYAVAGGEEFAYPGTQFAGANSSRPNTALAATTGKTRAEVVAELKPARADGSLVVGGVEFQSSIPAATNGRTRQEVRNEAIAAQRANKATGLESGN